MIHYTTTTYPEPSGWASLDGEHWLPVNQQPNDDEEDQIAALFEGDGNFKPMVFTRAILASWGAEGLEVEPRVVSKDELRQMVQGLQAQGDQENPASRK